MRLSHSHKAFDAETSNFPPGISELEITVRRSNSPVTAVAGDNSIVATAQMDPVGKSAGGPLRVLDNATPVFPGHWDSTSRLSVWAVPCAITEHSGTTAMVKCLPLTVGSGEIR